MATLPKEALTQLKGFVEIVKLNPSILNLPDLSFFKEFIEGFGGKIPDSKPSPTFKKQPPKPEPSEQPSPPKMEEESEESDIELDNEGIVDPDVAEPLDAFDETLEVSEEQIDQSNDKKRDAIHAYSEGEFEKAVDAYSEAIKLNPCSALLYAKRGQCYLQLNKPNACIRDCTRALVINPDSATAYKFRGRAHRLLGLWEDAARDLRDACKIDFDEQADEWLREVTPNARKLEEHRRKYERKRAEKDLREKQERIRRAKEEHAKAAANAAQENPTNSAGDSGFGGLFDDPDLLSALSLHNKRTMCIEQLRYNRISQTRVKIVNCSLSAVGQHAIGKGKLCFRLTADMRVDPEVGAALQDIYKNPANFMKYQDNPKISAVINKMAGKYSGLGGMAGGFPQFNFSGAGGAAPPPPPPSAPGADDVGLD